MDRILLINFWYIATTSNKPLDYLAWVPIALKPWPKLASVAHCAVIIFLCIAFTVTDIEPNIILPAVVSISAPLVLP